MKLKNLLGGAALAALVFTGCGDDYSPIYLVSVADQSQITDGQLALSPFSKGEKYLIRGGEGNYTIKNENDEVADYRYDGDTLTLLPISIGETHTLIADRAGNSYTLRISVNNPETNYLVDSISAEVDVTSGTTIGDEKALKARIIQEAPVQPGGRFLFTYSDASLAFGDLKIFPAKTGKYDIGVFERSELQYAPNGETFYQFEVEMATPSREHYTFMLFEEEKQTADGTVSNDKTEEDKHTVSLIKEEVTSQYTGEFGGLKKAYRIYHLTQK